ncbi:MULTISPECIES: MFS transporter [Caldilinea]|jgi:GPH family glycoside/pentoside/hexuronide:cation symporter|uniref:Putative major facilitator superfamily transporter n=1 Tax=Caldilinea aerophila (strain DSM 14535 / JCM 11387 / NBRC 104270 / STL-6-O1) TaxID=926550 RepID=I0I5T8_CALAS|nr:MULTISPECIES: MFS transporter [Caldilinea]MBO9392364.1 MFS transporter [Caldilinea sp.]BAM00626.1 putative major facilitator superfamily transporter [Caldilinea aerophila DSM 14535 = NBRC 104270]GIV71981.1 MAG: sodium:solute symporter [Caldilinea sp.]
MTSKPFLSPGKQVAYALGQLGWSTLVNIIGLTLVYFYLPPENAGLPTLITTAVFLGIFNAITLIAASGRLWDAITDPLIANLSDRLRHPRGRRIPFLAVGALPAALFCVLMFMPLVRQVSAVNIVWLVVMQMLFYLFLTVYVTPYFALLPELGHTATQRLNLSTWISITYALGIMVAAQTPALAGVVQSSFGVEDKMTAFQIAIAALAFVAMLLMYLPVVFIDENRYCERVPSTVPLLEAVRTTFRNQGFRYYVVADFAYFMALTIVNTGLLYYITVLLMLEEALVSALLTVMVVLSFVFYPAVNLLARRLGKKPLIVVSFFWMSIIFFGVFFLGRMPLPPLVQAYTLIVLYAIPIAFLGVLPNAVLADIAEHDAMHTGERLEGMFFAARTFMQKLGQTMGVVIFATLTIWGRNPGDDLGIRLSGMAGFVLCVAAGLIFLRYNERRVLRELEQHEAAS